MTSARKPIRGEVPRIFHVYPQGNFIEATEDTPYLQIVESKYGKPIIDRVIDFDSSLAEATKCALISFDSTIRSNLSVGLPIDMLLLVGMTCPQPYEIYGNHLYTNATSVEVEYQFKPDISAIPAYFALLMTYVLAKDMISPITENEAKHKMMQAKYIPQRDRALFADAQSRPARQVIHSPFTDVR